MKEFFKACKKRSSVLWILFFAWLTICTAIFAFVLWVTHTAWGMLAYIAMLLPMLHLMLYIKPMLGIEVAQIALTYLASFVAISSFLLPSAPTWTFIALILLCWAAALLLFWIELRTGKK